MSIDDDELARQFRVAVRWFQDRTVTLPVRLAWRDRLFLYSCYKQATAGDNNSPMPPSSARADRRQMWREWLKRKGQTRQHSMADYLVALDSLARHFDYSLLSSEQLSMRDRFLIEMNRDELRQAVKESDTRRASTAGSESKELAAAAADDDKQSRAADSAAADEQKQPNGRHSGAAAAQRSTTASPSPDVGPASAPAATGTQTTAASSSSSHPSSGAALASLQAANDASLSSLTSSLSALSSALAAPGSGHDRVSQLQQEMAALLSALEQRTAAAGEQWKESERRWEERLSRVQQMQEEMRRRLDSRHETQTQQSRTGSAQVRDGGRGSSSWTETGLVAAGSAIIIGYGAYRLWRWWAREMHASV